MLVVAQMPDLVGLEFLALEHDAPVGPQFQGGPMLNSSGELVGIASRSFAPLGFVPDTVFFGIPVREACAELVQCPAELD